MNNEEPDTGTPSEEQAPKKKTDARRSKGGDSSGLPPSFRVATGQEDWKPAESPEESSGGQVPWCQLFGIDFGDETTRIAGLHAANPILVSPKVIPTALHFASGSGEWMARGRYGTDAGMLKTRLRLGRPASIDGSTHQPEELVAQFFSRIHSVLRPDPKSGAPRAVLTVPSYYCSEERKQLISAVTAGGFRVLGLINDYAAPVLSYARRIQLSRFKAMVKG